MSKKRLQIEGIKNELEGASLYFTQSPTPPAQEKIKADQEIFPEVTPPASNLKASKKIGTLNKHGNHHASKRDSKIASTLTIKQNDPVKTIRKSVRIVGKEALFVRVTPDEKRELVSAVYTFNELYRGESQKTSENEISRIAIGYLLWEYRENGEQSILARVIAALNA